MKKMILKKSYWVLIIPFLFGISCSQDEGIGGNSHIQGCLIEKVYNEDFSLLLEERPAKDEDVFLIFGNQNTVGRDTETSYSGHFKFEYLWPGSYDIFYFSQDSTDFGIEKEVVIPIELGKKETKDLGKIYMISTLSWNRGTASIKGKVMLTNYKNSSSYPNLQVKDITPAQNQEVFLIYGNNDGIDERIRTSHDGTFEFKNLIKGNYLIYVLSEDVEGGTAAIPVSANVTINENGQVVLLETFNIEQL